MNKKIGIYNHMLMVNDVLDNSISLDEFKDEFKKSKAWLGKYITNFDVDYETNWWHCIREKKIDLDEFSAKYRYSIKKANEKFYVKIIEGKNYLEELYAVLLSASKKYTNCKLDIDKKNFFQFIYNVDCNPNQDIIATFDNEDNKLVAYGIIDKYPHYINFAVAKYDLNYLKKGVSYALTYFICNYYLSQPYKFVTDGERSIRHATNIQDFLYQKFHFRKAYCEIVMLYKWWVKVIIWVTKPFSKIIEKLAKNNVTINKLNAILILYKLGKENMKNARKR